MSIGAEEVALQKTLPVLVEAGIIERCESTWSAKSRLSQKSDSIYLLQSVPNCWSSSGPATSGPSSLLVRSIPFCGVNEITIKSKNPTRRLEPVFQANSTVSSHSNDRIPRPVDQQPQVGLKSAWGGSQWQNRRKKRLGRLLQLLQRWWIRHFRSWKEYALNQEVEVVLKEEVDHLLFWLSIWEKNKSPSRPLLRQPVVSNEII